MKIEKLCPATLHSAMLGAMNSPWEKVLHLASRQIYPPRAPLTLEGKALVDFFYLARGRLRLMHSSEDGSERAMLYVGSGNIFNESSAMAGFDAPDCRFFCMEQSEIYQFPGKLLHDRDFVAANPELIINLMTSLSTKMLIMHVELSNTVGTSAVRQVSRFLCSLARRHGEALEFDPDMTQDELAVLLGMHRASLVRALRVLRCGGALICFTKHRLQIGDMSLLKRLADE